MIEVRRCGNIINNSFVVEHVELVLVETKAWSIVW
jgi:hypothetical protein